MPSSCSSSKSINAGFQSTSHSDSVLFETLQQRHNQTNHLQRRIRRRKHDPVDWFVNYASQSRNHQIKLLLLRARKVGVGHVRQRYFLPRIAHTLHVLPHEFYFVGYRIGYLRSRDFPPTVNEGHAALRGFGNRAHERYITVYIAGPTSVESSAPRIVQIEHEGRKERQAVVIRNGSNF